MNLQELVNNFGKEKDYTEEEKKEKKLLSELLKDSVYNLLVNFLNERNIKTTGELKKINEVDYNIMKAKIPTIPGVGDYKTDLYHKKLDEIRKTKYSEENSTEENKGQKLKQFGQFKTSTNWSIEVNQISYNNTDEYIDIRQVKNDGTRGKGISIKKQDFNKFKDIILSIDLDTEIDDYLLETLIEENKNTRLVLDEIPLLDDITLDNSIAKTTLKTQILENEDKLYELFKDDFGLAIKLFKAKIESLKEDGDIVKFLENPSIEDIKKEQYDKIHSFGMKTAIDLKDEFDKRNLKYTTLESLKINDQISTMTICSIVNNYNVMLGMYYDDTKQSLILKCQIKDGPYEDRWIEENKKLYYCLQNETEENFSKLSFSKYPNTVCKNIIFGYDLNTKVYLFYRYNKNEDYTYAGEVKLEKFVNGNKAVIVNIE